MSYVTAPTTREQELALRNFEAAQNACARGLTKKGGGAAAENAYANSYQRLVTLGMAPKLRGKYRNSGHPSDNI